MATTLTSLNLNPPVFLAPMAGVTDKPSREIAQLFNPGLVVSEMIASSEKDRRYFEETIKLNLQTSLNNQKACPTAIQITGHEIEWMSYAAKVIEFEGGALIDLNMGCPAKKIVGKFAGSALMREPEYAYKIIESVVNSTSLPVTLKMRLGWDLESINAPTIARNAESCGVQMITVHARTRNQFFKGNPDWSLVRAVKESVSIPVIINGDIVDGKSAHLAMKKSCADGVMVGRGAIGKPWLLNELSKSVFLRRQPRYRNIMPMNELINLHLNKILGFYGTKVGLKIFRKHLNCYLKSSKLDSIFCKTLMTESSSVALEKKIVSAFENETVKVF